MLKQLLTEWQGIKFVAQWNVVKGNAVKRLRSRFMDLVDSYVKAVAKALPEAQREDIIGELSEDIRSEMEDKQKELGRPLTEEEQEGLLRQRGNPLLLAARYGRPAFRRIRRANSLVQFLFRSMSRFFRSTWALRFSSSRSFFTALAVSGRRSVLTTSFPPAC